MSERRLEVCVDDLAGLATAVAAGADRIELCSALAVGGLTPGPVLIERARRCGLPVHAMIRPRAGDFVHDRTDLEQMLAEIAVIRAAGLSGIVIGANRPGGALDGELLKPLLQAADGLAVTLHRAFDLVPDAEAALDQAIALGFTHLLTSGQAPTAAEGVDCIRRLVRRAAGRIVVMPGAGVSAENAALLLETGACELHASCSVAIAEDPPARRYGFAGETRRRTDAARIAALKAAISAFP